MILACDFVVNMLCWAAPFDHWIGYHNFREIVFSNIDQIPVSSHAPFWQRILASDECWFSIWRISIAPIILGHLFH